MSGTNTIGILALQGAVDLHKAHIDATGAQFMAVKTPDDFAKVDAFILPGGESTTMLKLIERFNLWDELVQQFKTKPVWGICAGAILMAKTAYRITSSPRHVEDMLKQRGSSHKSIKDAHLMDPVRASSANAQRQRDDGYEVQKSFGLLPITVQRNGYGRQLDSHETSVNGYDVSFIRAPVIEDAGDCEVLATNQEKPAWVRKGHYMATAFHPEVNLSAPSPMHEYFIQHLVAEAKKR